MDLEIRFHSFSYNCTAESPFASLQRKQGGMVFASGEIRQIASVEKRQFGSAEIRQFESIEKSQS